MSKNIIKQKIQNLKQPEDEPIPAFLRKTFEILEDQSLSDIISWSDDGLCIILKNVTEFTQKILPQYFKHNNLTSFVRQLNMYDFHKKKNPFYEYVFANELFQRGKRDLLKDIKRKNNDGTASSQKLKQVIDTEQAKQDFTHLFNENLYLKKFQQELIERVKFLEKRLSDLTLQNQNLWLVFMNTNNHRCAESSGGNLLRKCVDVYGLEFLKSFIASQDMENHMLKPLNKPKGFVPHHPDMEATKGLANAQAASLISPLLNYTNLLQDMAPREVTNAAQLHASADQLFGSDLHRTMVMAQRISQNNSMPSLQYLAEKQKIVTKNAIPANPKLMDNQSNFEFNLDQSLSIPSLSSYGSFDNYQKLIGADFNCDYFNDTKLLGKRKRDFDKHQQSSRAFHAHTKVPDADSYYEKIYKIHKGIAINAVDSDTSTNDERNRSCKSEDGYYEEDLDPNLRCTKSTLDGKRCMEESRIPINLLNEMRVNMQCQQ